MFSLKTTALKPSLIGITLWFVFAGCCALLLQLFWLPLETWILLIFSILGILFYCLARRLILGASAIGIDESGAFLKQGAVCYRLDFVRVNGVQIIAKVIKKDSLGSRFWPTYCVIFRDALPYYEYRVMRSYAAQQKMLKRSELTSK